MGEAKIGGKNTMKRKNHNTLPRLGPGVFLLSFLIFFTACAGLNKKDDTLEAQGLQPAADTGKWTWMSGDSETDQRGVYGTLGVAASTNKPGARCGAASWIDSENNLWLFGGYGFADKRITQYLDDLWKFDGESWTWVSGDCIKDDPGVYGTRGIAEGSNQPGARSDAVSWTDAEGNLWLFGGYGYDRYGAEGYLNDLWKFDGVNWVWVSGDNTNYEMGSYGSLGVAAGTNKPGSRSGAVGWVDSNDNLWLYGGHGNANIAWKDDNILLQNPRTGAGHLNDLWKFEP